MKLYRLALTAATLCMAACSSPPKPPTVDDSKKRPVNVSQAIDLQACRTELTAAQIVLKETLATQESRQALAFAPLRTAPEPSSPVGAHLPPNQVFVITFPLGSADVNLTSQEQARLVNEARMAKWISIRGRTDATADSIAETRLAQRRAEAAYKYLVDLLPLPPDAIRVSWQGAGDPLQRRGKSNDKQANRRVEIELYRAEPEVEILSTLRDPRILPSQAGPAPVL